MIFSVSIFLSRVPFLQGKTLRFEIPGLCKSKYSSRNVVSVYPSDLGLGGCGLTRGEKKRRNGHRNVALVLVPKRKYFLYLREVASFVSLFSLDVCDRELIWCYQLWNLSLFSSSHKGIFQARNDQNLYLFLSSFLSVHQATLQNKPLNCPHFKETFPASQSATHNETHCTTTQPLLPSYILSLAAISPSFHAGPRKKEFFTLPRGVIKLGVPDCKGKKKLS